MGTSRAAFILGTVSLLGASSIASAQAERQSQPMKGGKERAATAAEATPEKPPAAGVDRQKKLSMCLETWDAQTHMTRQEWRVACARSVRDYPDAFEPKPASGQTPRRAASIGAGA